MAITGSIYSLAKKETDLTSKQTFENMMAISADTGAVVIDGRNLAAGSIFAEQIHAGAITADKIKAGEIQTDHMGAGSIDVDRLKANQLILPGETYGGVKINNDGMSMKSTGLNVTLSSSSGFNITDKAGNQLIDIDPLTGNVIMQINEMIIGGHNAATQEDVEERVKNIELTPGPTGPAGADAISGVLTNESITFAANSSGNVQNYVGNTGNFLLMEGAINRSSLTSVTYSRVSQTNVNATIKSDGSYIISSMTDGTNVTAGQVTFRATYKNTTIDKTISISKSIAGQAGSPGLKGDPGAPGSTGAPGAAGSPATSYWLTSSSDTVTMKYDGAYDPKVVTFYGHSKTGTSNATTYAGYFIIQTSTNGTSYTQAYRSSSNQSSYAFTIPSNVSFVKAKFYQAGGTTYLLDEQTVPVLQSAENLEIGGRNLVLNTDGKLYRTFGSGATLSEVNGATRLTWSGSAQTSMGEMLSIPLIVGETYTLAFEARGTISPYIEIYILAKSGANLNLTNYLHDRIATATFKKYAFTFEFTGNPSDRLFIGGRGPAGTWLEVKDNTVKLEKGNKATDWTPAPEDVERSYTAVAVAKANLAETQAKAHADGKVTAEEKRAIKEAKDKLAEAKKHAEDKAGTAETNAKDYAKKQVDDIEVGGRNLLRGTSDEWKSSTMPQNGWNNTFYGLYYLDDYDLKSGDTVTMSIELDVQGAVGLRARFETYGTESNRRSYLGNVIKNGRGTSTVTLTIPTGQPRFRVMAQPYPAPSASSFVYQWRKAKVERGNKATDWTPAPEDVQSQIDSRPTFNDFDRTDKVTINGGNIKAGTISSDKNYSWIDLDKGHFSFGNKRLVWNGSEMTVNGKISVTNIDGKLTDSQISSAKTWNDKETTAGAKAKADAAVKALEVGGRNLLLNTNGITMNSSDQGNNNLSVVANDGTVTITPKNNGNVYNNGGFRTSVDRVQGETYTLSFEINTTRALSMYWRPSNNKTLSIPNTSGNWRKFTHTYKQVGATKLANTGFLVGFSGLVAGQRVRYRGFKLERGNKETDWTPAPEDVDASAQAKANTAEKRAKDYAGKTFRAYAIGYSNRTDTGIPFSNGRIMDENGNSITSGNDRSYLLVVIDRNDNVLFQKTYDVYSGATHSKELADKLNSLDRRHLVILVGSHAPGTKRTLSGLPQAIYRCGGTPEVFIDEDWANHPAYLLVGRGGIGEGNGFESFSSKSDGAMIDVNIPVKNGTTPLVSESDIVRKKASNAKTKTDAWSYSGTVEIDGGKIRADTINVNKLTGNMANFISAGFNSISSNLNITSTGLKITTTDSWDMHLVNNGIRIVNKHGTNTGRYAALVNSTTKEPTSIGMLAEKGFSASLGYKGSNTGNAYSSAVLVNGTSGEIRLQNDIRVSGKVIKMAAQTIYPNLSRNDSFTVNALDTGGIGIRSDHSSKVGFFLMDTGVFRIEAGNGVETDTVTLNSVKMLSSSTSIERNGTNGIRVQTGHGYLDMGAQNSAYMHFRTDRGSFWFNKEIIVPGLDVTGSITGNVQTEKNTGKAYSTINATNSSGNRWNDEANSSLKLINNNNALSFIVGGTQNNRHSIIQGGHKDGHYASALGSLRLNKLGGTVYVGSGLSVSGTKNAIHPTRDGLRATPAYEMAESYLGDMGEDKTGLNNKVKIMIDTLFFDTVNTDYTYHVFLQAHSNNNVWVEEREKEYFIIASDSPEVSFSWEMKAKRRGFEKDRLVRDDEITYEDMQTMQEYTGVPDEDEEVKA